MDKTKLKIYFNLYRGRILGVLIGFIFAILWMTMGFAKALAVALVVGVAYIVGAYLDGAIDLESWLDFFRLR